jgi:hypothetical protein
MRGEAGLIMLRRPRMRHMPSFQQFFMHIEKVNKLHVERNSMMRYSIAATFAYFGWIFTHPDIAGSFQSYFLISAPIWLLPFGFNLFGWWRNRVLINTIQKHGEFLDYLLRQGMAERNYFQEYLESEDRDHKGAHNTEVYWRAIVLISFVTAAGGILTDTLFLSDAIAAIRK